jgi:hypothetical protein
MCNVNSRNLLSAAACALALSFWAAIPAQAATINVTYALTGSGGGDPLNPPLIGNATGSLLPLGSVIWSDQIFPNLATGAGDGTFTMTFTDGDTLFGTAHYQGDFSTFPIVPFTQLLTVTGGTGALFYYQGHSPVSRFRTRQTARSPHRAPERSTRFRNPSRSSC